MKKFTFSLMLFSLACSALLAAGPAWTAVPGETAGLDEIMNQISGYQFGDSREPLTQLTEQINTAHGSVEALAEIERKMLDILRSDATWAGKQFICKQLSLIGTAKAVPVLASMLTDSSTSNMSRYALERIPGAEVDRALRNALQPTSGAIKVGIINTIGMRKDKNAVSELSGLLNDNDAEIVDAAAAALGHIGGSEAASALQSRIGTGRIAVLDAYLKCADHFSEQGNKKQAAAIYEKLYSSASALPIRGAAIKGLLKVEEEKAAERILEILQKDEPAIQAVAIQSVRRLPQSADLGAIADQLSRLSAAAQVQLLAALGDRGDTSIKSKVLETAKHDSAQVRIAALAALGKIGEPGDVIRLAVAAAQSPEDEAEAARNSLYHLRGTEVDGAVMQAIPDAEPAVKAELIRAAAERNIVDAVDLLLKMSKDPDGQVRIQVLKSLAVLARPDRIPALLERLSAIENDTERREAERTVIAVARKIPEQKQQGDPVLEALPAAESEPYRASLLQILGRIGDTDALPALRDALSDNRESVRTAAIRALSAWPGPAPLDDLYKIARSSDSEIERVLAVRGIITLIETGDWPDAKRVEHYGNAMELASATNEKNMVLSGLAKFPSPEALVMAQNALEEQALRGAAEVAVVQIARGISDDHPDMAKKACEQLLKTTKRENVREDAAGVLERIGRNE